MNQTEGERGGVVKSSGEKKAKGPLPYTFAEKQPLLCYFEAIRG